MFNGYRSYRVIQTFSQLLPRGFAYWIGLRLADLYYTRDRRGREAVMGNLRQILSAQGIHASDQTLRRMARDNFRFFGKYIIDFFKFARFTPEDIRRLISIEHPEYLEQFRLQGRGGLLVTAHLGNWELGAAVLAGLGFPIHAVYQPERASKINRLFQRHRERRGIHVIPLGQAARNLIAVLKRKEFVAMLADRDYTTHQDVLPFFGAPARLPSGPARLAVRMDVPLLPGFLLRQPGDTFILRLYPPVCAGGDSDAIRHRLRDVLEEEIRRSPLQWFMFESFWGKP